MKKHFTTSFFFLLGFALFAQAPQLINYQAVARDGEGNAKPGAGVTVEFRILHGGASGTPVFTETQSTTTDNCGMFNLKIGATNPNSFSQIDWTSGSKWLEVKINSVLMGTTQMLSVPYALYAERSSIQHVQAFQSTNVSGATQRLVDVPVPGVQVTVPTTGNYLILANLGGSATNGDSYLSGIVRKLVTGGTQDIFDFRVQAKPQTGEILPGGMESSGWTMANLSANDVIRLDYNMGSWANPPDSSPFNVNRGKLMLIKLD